MLTYDALINGDNAFIKQITRTTPNIPADTDYAHFLWQIYREGKSPIRLIKELNGIPIIQPADTIEVRGTEFLRLNSFGDWEGTKLIQYTSFLLFKKYLENDNWMDIMEEMRELGFDGPRFFLMCHNLASFNPSYSLSRLNDFVKLLNAKGQIPEVVVLADAQYKLPVYIDQQLFLNDVCSALFDTTQLIELGNEWKQNGFDPYRFYRPVNAKIISRGSGLGGEFPIIPAWDYSTIHNRRDLPKAMLIGRYIYFSIYGDPDGATPGTHGPVMDNEPLGAGDINIPGNRSNDVHVFRRLAREAVSYGCGATFHYESGLRSELISPIQKECAKAFIQGAVI